MAYTNRTAPEDTAIKREGLNENIEAAKPGRYYPDDYSTMIRINEQNQGLKGEIPKTLSSIVEYYDDYKISTWAHEETTRIQENKIDNHYQELMYEEERKLDMLNEHDDRVQHLLSDLDNVAEAAKSNPDIKMTDAVSEVLDQYADVEGLSPAAREQWERSFSGISQRTLSEARAKDFEDAYTQNKFNIQNLINTAQADVRNGKFGSVDAFTTYLPELLKYKEHMIPAEFESYVNSLYDNCVMAEALLYKRAFETGDRNGEDTTKLIYDLLQSHKSMTFEGTDGSGKDYKFTCSLSEQTQNFLMNVFTDTKNKGGGAADTNIDIDTSDWEERIGWNEIEKNGYSQQVIGMTPEEFKDFETKTIAAVYVSGASDAKKMAAVKKIVEQSGLVKAQLLLTGLLPQYGENTARAYQTALTTLERDLKDKKDFSNYSLKISLGGKDFTIIDDLTSDYYLPFGNKDLASRAYWNSYKEGLQKLSKFLNNKPISVAVAQLDKDLASRGATIIGATSRSNLISGEGESSSVARSSAFVQSMNDYFKAWSKYPNLNPVLSDQIVQGMLQNMNDPSLSEQDKFLMAKSIAFNLTDTKGAVKPNKNVLPDFASYIARTGDMKANKVFTGLVLLQDNPEIKAISDYMQNPETKKTFKDDYRKGNNSESINKIYSQGDIYKKLHIDKNAEAYFTDFSDTVKAYVGHSGTHNPGTDYEKIMKKAIDPLFLEHSAIKGTGLQSRPFLYSPQMKIYNDAKDKDAFTKNMTSVYQRTQNMINNVKIPGSKANVSIYSDDAKGAFYITINGRRIKNNIPGQSGYMGAVLNTKNTINNPDFVGNYNAILFKASLGANDEKFRKAFEEESMPVSDKDKKFFNRDTASKMKEPNKPTSSNALNSIKYASDMLDYYTFKGIKAGTDKLANTSSIHSLKTFYGQKADNKIQTNYAAIAETMSNPKLFEKASKLESTTQKSKNYGSIQNLNPRSPVVQQLLNWNEKTYAEYPNNYSSLPSQYAINETIFKKTKLQPSITGFASDLPSDEQIEQILNEPSETEQPEKYTDEWYAQEGYTEEEYAEMMAEAMEVTSNEMSPELYEKVVDYVTQTSSYAEKVNTADVSIPVTHAAIGNEGYIDAYNNATQMGFEVNDAFIPGATLDTYTPEREYDGPTGYASNIDTSVRTTGLCMDGTITTPPKAGQKDTYTKNDIKDLVDYYSGVFNVPSSLAHAMFIQESGYNTKAKSHAGAYGVAQLMPMTAKGLGVDINDPAQNLWGGMKYLATQFQSFGNWSLALAAYNAGPGAVKKAGGIPKIKETQNYVKNILRMAGFNTNGEYAVTFNLTGGNIKFIDENTGRLSPKAMNDFAYMLKGPGYKDKIQVIYTDRKELTENKPENEAFAKYREMKTTDNKPMFAYKSGVNGFSVVLKDGGSFSEFNPVATASIADSVAKTQTSFLPENNKNQIESLINTFADRYKNPAEMLKAYTSNQFGLAKLTPKEYADYGVTPDVAGNPELQARVLNLEFQRAINILGTDYKAIYALAGGNVIDEHGNVKSWREVKEDREAYRKQWFIKPSEDSKQRNIANAYVESYQKYYARLRGEL